MSFRFENMTSIGQKIANTPNVFTYSTGDLITNVRKAGYFTDPRIEFNQGDIINVAALDGAITLAVDSLSPVAVIKATGKDFVEFHLLELPQDIVIPDDDSTFVVIDELVIDKQRGFVDNANGSFTKINNGGRFLFIGTSDVNSNKAIDITYSLFVDGQPRTDQQTLHTIAAADGTNTLAICSLVDIPINSTMDVRVKGDGTLNATITINKLDVVLTEL